MNLKHIQLEGDAKENSKLIKELEKLPNKTVEGITSYGSFQAKLLEDGIVKMGQYDPVCMDELTVNVPEGAANVSLGRKRIAFEYEGTNYQIEI